MLYIAALLTLLDTSYPAVYLVCIAPVSISRWIAWSRPNHPPPPAAIIFSNAIFSLSGVFNVTLFTITRPTLVRGSVESLVNPPNVEMHSRGQAGTVTGSSHCHCRCHPQGSEPIAGRAAPDQTSDGHHHHTQSQSQGTILPPTPTHMKHTAYLQSHKRGQLPD